MKLALLNMLFISIGGGGYKIVTSFNKKMSAFESKREKIYPSLAHTSALTHLMLQN